MSEDAYITIDGVEFVLCQFPGAEDLWMPASAVFDGPNDPRPLSQWRKVLAEWKVAKQIAAGFPVWDISHDSPNHWRRREAVFRQGLPRDDPNYRNDLHTVFFRNGAGDRPDNLYSIARGYAASDTPETLKAIEEAKFLYKAAQDAVAAWKKAKNAIPCLPEDEWKKLPVKPEKFS